MIDSKIQWCDDTANVVEGCAQVDGDCKNCYAMGMAARFAQDQVISRRESDGAPMEYKPGHYAGIARLSPGRRLPQWTGEVRLRPDVLDAWFWRLLRARSPRRQFLCSMGDLFHAAVPDAFLDDVFARIAILESRRPNGFGGAEPHPIYMLTKRPERAAAYTNAPDVEERIDAAARAFILRERELAASSSSTARRRAVASLCGFAMPAWPHRSVALITSAGTQAGANARVPWILRCKAAMRGVSCEPMTEPGDFSRWMPRTWGPQRWDGRSWCNRCCNGDRCDDMTHVERRNCTACGGSGVVDKLSWMILGGESGDDARQCEIDWMDAVAAQCKAGGVPLFVKQLGNVLAAKLGRDGKGGKLEDLPEHLRIRQFPRIPERIQ